MGFKNSLEPERNLTNINKDFYISSTKECITFVTKVESNDSNFYQQN